ncbi:MAG: hypothetical protein LRZ85_04500 [Alphaproteobacteria bacterium]|nr:hypothetical protein [Alphaproteobacteria bacterium]MCD8571471.1 hypothetical protein [Alphaproteobacteria bacterium]
MFDPEAVITKTIEYLTVPAVVGHEFFFMEALARDYERLGLTIQMYPGLVAISGSAPQSAYICAHIDRHGLVSIGNGEYVYAARHIREFKYGEEHVQARTELESIVGRFVGEAVYAYDPFTGMRLGDGIITADGAEIQDGENIFHIDGMPDLPPEIPVAYARKAQFENERLEGQIDNAISLGIVHALFRGGFQGTALLACEEEIGKSWIPLADYLKTHTIETRSLIILDTSPYSDPEPIETGRVILRNRDFSETFNPRLVARLKERITALDIPFQVKDEYLMAQGKTVEQVGSTELGRLLKWTNRQWSGATVQIPTQMYHTSHETTGLKAITNYYRFLHNILVEDLLPMPDI